MQNSILFLLATMAASFDTMPDPRKRTLVKIPDIEKILGDITTWTQNLTKDVAEYKQAIADKADKLGNGLKTALDSVYDDFDGQLKTLVEEGDKLLASWAKASKETLTNLSAANAKITKNLEETAKTTYTKAMTGYKTVQDLAMKELEKVNKDTDNKLKEAEKLQTALTEAATKLNGVLAKITDGSGSDSDAVAGEIAKAINESNTETQTAVDEFRKANGMPVSAATTFRTLSLTATVLLLAA